MKSKPENYFDRGKIFYPFVMNYLYSLHGFVELVSRGFIHNLDKIQREQSDIAVEKEVDSSLKLSDALRTQLKERRCLTPLIVELELSTSHGAWIKVPIDEMSEEAFTNGAYLAPFLCNAGAALLTTCYSLVADWDDSNIPIWNFLYHCRNAAAHGMKFRIDKNRFPAEWRGIKITKECNGRSLFHEQQGESGLLYVGDPITLLWDIEQLYPTMKLK